MTVTAEAPASTLVTAPAWRKALTIALGIDAALCAFLIFLVGEVIPPVIVFGVLFVTLAVLTMKIRRSWPQWVTIVLSVLFIGGNMPFIIEDLAHPETIAGFAPIWLLVLATIFVLSAAVMVVRKSAGSPRVFAMVFVAVAVVGVVGSAVSTAGVKDDSRQAGDVALIAEDVEYPAELTVEEGDAIFIENRDPFRHTFVVDDYDVKQEVPGNASRRVVLNLEPGTYVFRCDVPGHETMEGVLAVE